MVIASDVKVAGSYLSRLVGLMGRRRLQEGEALFLPGTNSIHMLFMRFPIDCLFLGAEAQDGSRPVVGLRNRLPPWRGVVWYVRGAHGVVEAPAGTVGTSGVHVGDLVRLESAV